MTDLVDALRPRLPDGCTARPLGLADVDDTFFVYSCAQLVDCGLVVMERADIVADWSRPSMHTETDTVGVWRDGDLVAAAEVARRGTRAEAAVQPHHRGLRIGTWLAAWTEARATAMGSATVGQTVPVGSAGQRLLEARGYREGHTSWVLELPPGTDVPRRDLPPGFVLRSCETGADHRAAYEVVDRAFGEWSDRSGETFEEWAAGTVRRAGFAPWQLRVTEGNGEVAGVCFTVVDEMGCGYVGQLAVAREHRGRGLAQALLADGFANARDHGAVRSELSTDTRTGALDLYLGVGMRVSATWVHLVTDLLDSAREVSP